MSFVSLVSVTHIPSLTSVGPYIFTDGPHEDGMKPTVLSDRLKTTLKPCITTVPVHVEAEKSLSGTI